MGNNPPLPERGDFKLSVSLKSLFIGIFPPHSAPASEASPAYLYLSIQTWWSTIPSQR